MSTKNWIVRCNRDRFDLDRWTRQGYGPCDIEDWSVVERRHGNPQEDDRIVWWISGTKPGDGGAGLGRVAGEIFEALGTDYWLDRSMVNQLSAYLPIDLTTDLSAHPIPWSALKTDPVLARALFVRRPNGANPQELTDAEWRALVALVPMTVQRTMPRWLRRA